MPLFTPMLSRKNRPGKNHAKDKIIEFLATGFFVGLIPGKLTGFKKLTGAGFLGTCLALLSTPFLPEGHKTYGVLLAAFLIFSIKVADEASILYGTHDDPRIVVDEIAGYLIAVAFMERTIFSLTSAFIFFRILDTLKPWPIKWLEKKLSGGWGVVSDDALAGIEANLLTRLLALWQF